ncbi:divisome protein SepX/GlpR [Streptomyces niger]|uniref:divisome protein SepX/GlpR n=1 Tax=Streptomyces niger TaxID=66373 RepID=UPI00069B1FAD|nr:gephyrin-like molybdotransferase receptor GlpR [Streptomyces niger]
MSSSGLIYAVIVGAWAAYLVPMWLRRQDELNEARPTERFSTAIRLLSGRAAMERRYAKGQEGRSADDADGERDPDVRAEAADVRSASAPADEGRPPGAHSADARVPEEREAPPTAVQPPAPAHPHPRASSAERTKRARVLARRRRTITVLFLAFTLGAVVAGVGGITYLWVPAVPAVLLSAYIVYLRVQERRRFAFTMDQRQAEVAAQRLREGRARPSRAGARAPAEESPAAPAAPVPEPAGPESVAGAGRRAPAERPGRQHRPPSGDGAGWDPVPVPLPTYVTAPVAPRAGGSVDLGADDAWSSARSSTAGGAGPAAGTGAPAGPASGAGASGAGGAESRPAPGRDRPAGGRRGRTPLFDQYAAPADEGLDRPRAANE